MKCLAYFTEVLVGDMCVDLCGRNVGVAEECLDRAEVGAVFQGYLALSADV